MWPCESKAQASHCSNTLFWTILSIPSSVWCHWEWVYLIRSSYCRNIALAVNIEAPPTCCLKLNIRWGAANQEKVILKGAKDDLSGSTKAQCKINKDYFKLWIMQSYCYSKLVIKIWRVSFPGCQKISWILERSPLTWFTEFNGEMLVILFSCCIWTLSFTFKCSPTAFKRKAPSALWFSVHTTDLCTSQSWAGFNISSVAQSCVKLNQSFSFMFRNTQMPRDDVDKH